MSQLSYDTLMKALTLADNLIATKVPKHKAIDEAAKQFNLGPKDHDWLISQLTSGEKTINLSTSFGEITVRLAGGGGTITSTLKTPPSMEEEDVAFKAAVDTVESFILSLAIEGYDLTDPRFVKALEEVLTKIDNNT